MQYLLYVGLFLLIYKGGGWLVDAYFERRSRRSQPKKP
jgi:hypothetical protein